MRRTLIQTLGAGGACLLLLAPLAPSLRAADGNVGDQIVLAIIVSRHGVRAPLQPNEALARYSARAWPEWEVKPAIQTPRGNQLVGYMGDYYRARFMRSGLLSGDPATDGPLVYIRADNDQRTIETGRIIGKALVPVGEPDVHPAPGGTFDPLFQPYRAHVGHPDLQLAEAAVLGRLGGDPQSIDAAFAPQLAELRGILWGGAPAQGPLAEGEHSRVSEGTKHYLVSISGPIQAAEVCVDGFILEYADGKADADVGWGKVDGKVLTDLLALHDFFFDLADRTYYLAQVNGSNLASHIVDTLEQAASGDPVPGAIGPSGEKIVVLAGHDSNLASLGGLLGMNWWIPGTQMNPTLPGSALVFELWRKGGEKDAYFVRTSYVSGTLEQLRTAAPLSLASPPALAPIFIPGCGGDAPNFDATLPDFIRQARKVIAPSFTEAEP
ncbi:MAG TPA: histidine-type phosphatase [Opitutaceae bacterium]|jgi:4-phytase/acid phosphatase